MVSCLKERGVLLGLQCILRTPAKAGSWQIPVNAGWINLRARVWQPSLAASPGFCSKVKGFLEGPAPHTLSGAVTAPDRASPPPKQCFPEGGALVFFVLVFGSFESPLPHDV